jgi:tetratricopeptide (TPR) repeat protein/CHAT domain-containing protein
MRRISRLTGGIWLLLFLQFALIHGNALAQSHPAALCEEGVRLYEGDRIAEALLLLEAGFADRENADFPDPDALGRCALALGVLRGRTGHPDGAMEAYTVALGAFQSTGKRIWEGTTLNNIGGVHRDQGRYAEALEAYQQALSIFREVGDRVLEETTLGNIGKVHRSQGRHAEALEAYQQALSIARELGERALEGTTLNIIGLVYHAQGRYAESLEAHQQALSIRREVGDRVGEGRTLSNIGSVYGDQGRYAEAVEVHQQAIGILREEGDRLGEGKVLNNIGSVYHDQGRYAEALESFEEALVIAREVDDRTGEAAATYNIGSVYHDQGRYTESLEIIQQALSIMREEGDRVGEVTALNIIGEIYYHQGRYHEALEAYQQVLNDMREVVDRVGEATALSNIGSLYAILGRYAEALEAQQRALSIAREVGDQTGEGTALNNIGGVYQLQALYDKALEAYERALSIKHEVGDRTGEGTVLNNIGMVYHDRGSYAEALETLQQALSIIREEGDRAMEGPALNNIGMVYYDRGRYAEALEAFQQALSIRSAIGDRGGEGNTLNNIGMVYHHQGRYAEALEALQQALSILRNVGTRAWEGGTLNNIGLVYQQQRQLEQAAAYYEQAMSVVESLRATAGSESGRAGFISQYASLYQRSVELYMQQGQAEEALFTSERGRARAFLDSLATGQVQLADNEAEDLWYAEQAAYAARQAAQDALAQAKGRTPPDPQLVSDLEAQLAAAETEHQAALEAIQARGDQLAALVPGRSTVLTLSEVQALLDEHTTLVSYFVLGESGTLAFIITQEGFETIELPQATPDNLLGALIDLRLWATLDDPYPQPLQDLHTWLVAPLAEHLITNQIGIIPHQLLHYVPFAALTDGQSYFSDQHTLFNLPSASAYQFIQQNAQTALQIAAQPALVFGNPDTGEPNLSPLLHAESEAKAVAEMLQAPTYTGAAASEEQFWQAANDAEIIHLAAHGGYNSANPLYSAIYLGSEGEQDGLLEVHEIYSLDLSATDLVVLSACETNVGQLSAGDEVVGLTRAFFFTGTPTVIASLWNVDDEATAKLMESFYSHLQAGLDKAEALKQAQVEVREEHPSPYYGAAFVLSGDPGIDGVPPALSSGDLVPPSSVPGPKIIPWVLAGGIAVIIIIAWLWSKQKRKNGP